MNTFLRLLQTGVKLQHTTEQRALGYDISTLNINVMEMCGRHIQGVKIEIQGKVTEQEFDFI
jgi:hypothetical protein